MKNLFISILVALLSMTSCNAQLPGLPKIPKTVNSKNNNIHCALQDKAGDLWFGTTGDGIYRYDGKTFVNYSEKDGIGSNRVHAMLEDRDGNIWVGTDAGASRYDPSVANSTGKKAFQYFPITEAGTGNFFIGKAVSETAVWSMMQDDTGKMWFGTQKDGVFCYDGKTLTRFLEDKTVANESNLKIHAVNCIKQDKAGNIWFATWFEGLCRYDGKSIVSFKPNNEVWYTSMLEDKDGTMWVGRRTKGFFQFDPTTVRNDGSLNHTNVLQHGTLDSCSVGLLLQDKSGVIWLGSIHSNMTMRETHGGLWRFDPSATGTARFKNITAKDGLPNNNVWSAVEDKDGNIWFGTVGTGLYRYNPSTAKTGSKTFESFSD